MIQDRSAEIIKLLAACMRAGTISGVHPITNRKQRQTVARTLRPSKQTKLRAEIQSALEIPAPTKPPRSRGPSRTYYTPGGALRAKLSMDVRAALEAQSTIGAINA